MRSKAEVKAYLQEALRWIDERDDALERARNLGLWFWDESQSEMISFVEHPRYAEYLDVYEEDVVPYLVYLVPLTPEQLEEVKQDMYQAEE